MENRRFVFAQFITESEPDLNKTSKEVRVDVSGPKWGVSFGGMSSSSLGVLDSLEWVTSALRKEEWRLAIESLASLPAYQESLALHSAVFKKIINSDPADLERLSEVDFALLRAELPAGMIENLRLYLSAIVNKPTVFLFPEYVSESIRGNKEALQGFTAGLALDVQNVLRIEQACRRYGFMFYEAGRDGFDFKGLFLSNLVSGSSRVMEEHEAYISRPGPVLFEGSTGSGKSHAARSYAQRNGKKFFKVNVSSVQESFIETRLRGYLKGYHSMAKEDSPGWLESAKDGVLLLDEFQSAPLHVQTQLLDIIDATSNRVRVARMGGEGDEQSFDVKLILAVNKPIKELLKSGQFREDLYYRMRSVVHFPSLNSLLSESSQSYSSAKQPSQFVLTLLRVLRWKFSPLIKREAGLDSTCELFLRYDDDAVDLLVRNEWNGNFREFETVVADLYSNLDAVGVSSRVTFRDVEKAISGRPANPAGRSAAQNDAATVASLIENALIESSFVLTKASKRLEHLKMKDYSTLLKKIEFYFEYFSPQTQLKLKKKRIFADLKLKSD